MKKLILAIMLITGVATFAQDNLRAAKLAETEKLTPEQRNQLQVKKMTLELGLDAAQQKEVSKIISEQNAKREAMVAERKSKKESNVKPTAEERFKMKNEMMDQQIAVDAKMKKILTDKQYDKWKSTRERRHAKMERKHEHREVKAEKNADVKK
ncbi:MAG: hypothetical protein EOO51_10080 [Flavobacterium sp.]|nr:MAG: hypothetical protein EOO51_10080 [Flavobacterium sp.]